MLLQSPPKGQTKSELPCRMAAKLVAWEVHICGTCFYKFDELAGDVVFGISPRTTFESLPTNFRCPNCDGPKVGFFPAHCIAWA